MTETVRSVVIGGGVVGLAIARALAQAGLEPLLLEANGLLGAETSSRNSEVVHAGMYYPTESARARLCVRGRRLLAESEEKPCEIRGQAFTSSISLTNFGGSG